jgi:hypothetical protein
MGRLLSLIKRWILCSISEERNDVIDDGPRYVQSSESSLAIQSQKVGRVTRFGISADCTLTSRNIETMYDIEEDLTVVAERVANSAALTTELLDTLLDMMDSVDNSPVYIYGNKPCLRAELE